MKTVEADHEAGQPQHTDHHHCGPECVPGIGIDPAAGLLHVRDLSLVSSCRLMLVELHSLCQSGGSRVIRFNLCGSRLYVRIQDGASHPSPS